MRCAVIGGVSSTEVLLRARARRGGGAVAVGGATPWDRAAVAGWRDVRTRAGACGFESGAFRKVGGGGDDLVAFAPDVLFGVGLSQSVPADMLSIAKTVNVGFHPTALPHGRGRAAIAWLILHRQDGAATFFELRGGVDDGPVFVQERFAVDEGDDAACVLDKLLRAEARALDDWLPRLAAGDVSATEQDHARATWLGRRAPEDGEIDWSAPRGDVLRLIRASAPPHPGAFTFHEDTRITILRAALTDRPETGVTGRILAVRANGAFDIQASDGLLEIEAWHAPAGWSPRVGMLLGYATDSEIFRLRNRVGTLERRLAELEATMRSRARGTVTVRDLTGGEIAAAGHLLQANLAAENYRGTILAGTRFALFLSEVLAHRSRLVGAFRDECLVGAAQAVPNEGRTHLNYIAVAPSERGSGAAGLLLENLKAQSEPGGMSLHVDARNPAALRFYEKQGFHETARQRFGLARTGGRTPISAYELVDKEQYDRYGISHLRIDGHQVGLVDGRHLNLDDQTPAHVAAACLELDAGLYLRAPRRLLDPVPELTGIDSFEVITMIWSRND